jgi:carboxyl-terminal processing protease
LIEKAKAAKAKALVLDLSANGGGSLQDAVEVAGLFIGSGNVVGVGGRGEAFQALADADPAVQWPGPLVIWTSRVSASASEIVSGALKDYNRAVIVGGDHTFGKGTVQAIEKWTASLGALKTTTAMFYTAGGYSTQHRGVPGDIVYPSVLAHQKISEESLPNSLPGKKRQPFLSSTANVFMGPGEWQLVNKDVIDHLRTKAEKRMAKSKDFKKLRDDIKKQQKKPPTLLTVGDLLKGKNLAAEKDEEADDKDQGPLTRDERIKKYLERPETLETLQIAADLVKELRP